MNASQPTFAGEELRRRAQDIYRRRITAQDEAANDDRYVSIDVISGDLEIGDDFIEVVHRLKARQPNGQFYSFRVGDGGRPVDRIGSFQSGPFRPEGAR